MGGAFGASGTCPLHTCACICLCASHPCLLPIDIHRESLALPCMLLERLSMGAARNKESKELDMWLRKKCDLWLVSDPLLFFLFVLMLSHAFLHSFVSSWLFVPNNNHNTHNQPAAIPRRAYFIKLLYHHFHRSILTGLLHSCLGHLDVGRRRVIVRGRRQLRGLFFRWLCCND